MVGGEIPSPGYSFLHETPIALTSTRGGAHDTPRDTEGNRCQLDNYLQGLRSRLGQPRRGGQLSAPGRGSRYARDELQAEGGRGSPLMSAAGSWLTEGRLSY